MPLLRLFGPPKVEKLKAKRDITGLIKALAYPQETAVRSAAAQALRELGDPRAIQPLISALEDADSAVRESATAALVEIGAPAVKPLIAAFKDSGSDVRKPRARESIVEALVKIGATAVEPLIAALGDWHVQKLARNALIEIGAPAVGPLIAAVNDSDWDVQKVAAMALGKIRDVRAVEPLIAKLRDSNFTIDVFASVTEALAAIGDTRAVEPLIAKLKDSHRWSGEEEAAALGKIGDTRAVEPLVAKLKNSTESVMEAVALALDRLGWQPDQSEEGACYWVARDQFWECVEIGAPAVEPLIAALNHIDRNLRDSDLRELAAEALGDIGDTRAVEPLIAALEDNYFEVRKSAACALAAIGDTRAVEPLIAALKRNYADRRLAEEAASALDRLGWQPDQTEKGAWYWIVRQRFDKCVEISAPAVEPLIAALWLGVESRKLAISALGEIGETAVKPLIAKLERFDLNGDKVAVNSGEEEALAKIGAPAVEPLIACLKSYNRFDRGQSHRIRAARALGKIEDPHALEPLIAAVLKDSDDLVRKVAERALGRIGRAHALEPLIAASNGDLSWAEALRKLR